MLLVSTCLGSPGKEEPDGRKGLPPLPPRPASPHSRAGRWLRPLKLGMGLLLRVSLCGVQRERAVSCQQPGPSAPPELASPPDSLKGNTGACQGLEAAQHLECGCRSSTMVLDFSDPYSTHCARHGAGQAGTTRKQHKILVLSQGGERCVYLSGKPTYGVIGEERTGLLV